MFIATALYTTRGMARPMSENERKQGEPRPKGYKRKTEMKLRAKPKK